MGQHRDSPHLRPVLRILAILTTFAGVAFAVINFKRELYPIVVMEVLFSIASLYVWSIIPHTHKLKMWAAIFTAALFICILIALSFTSSSMTVIVWLFIVPLLAYLLLGRHLGLLVTGPMEIIALYLYGRRFDEPFEVLLSIDGINVLVCIMAAWAFSHIYESTRERSQANLIHQATVDPLTNLYNRSLMSEIFTEQKKLGLARDAGLSLIVLDLDHFKQINDTYGHDAGDQVLIRVAAIIQGSIRKSDFAFRVGGEEFCVLLPMVDKKIGVSIAQQLRKSVEQEVFSASGRSFGVTLSAGISYFPDDGEELEGLYGSADHRLYEAKDAGRNRIVSS